MTAGVYKILCKANGRFYIGSSHNIEARWREHRCRLGRNKHHSQHMQAAWNKYGADNFEFSIILSVSDRLARQASEQATLDELQPFGSAGFNARRQVYDTLGHPCREATKEKHSAAKRGDKNPMHGSTWTATQRAATEKRAAGNRGKKRTIETRRKISEIRKARGISERQIAAHRGRRKVVVLSKGDTDIMCRDAYAAAAMIDRKPATVLSACTKGYLCAGYRASYLGAEVAV